MSSIKTARRPIHCLPPRCPFAGITIVRRGVESQPGNDGEGVTLASVDGDPFAGATLAVAAKFGRAHRCAYQSRRTENILDSA